jgi:hypothetical protein
MANAFANIQTNLRSNDKSGSSTNQLMSFFIPVICVILVYIGFLFVEIVYKYINRMTFNRVELLPNTYTIGSKSITIRQDPLHGGTQLIHVSDNERTGIEFTYTFYLNVDPSAFSSTAGLLHIFHKGYTSQFPLLAPGVYMRSDTNTLRVYMNTFKTWNNYIEIENIPLSKWVHVAIECKENSLEIFINGNLSKKLSFDGFAPYQNFQDLICFSQASNIIIKDNDTTIPVTGALKGMMSRLTYYNYALCYAEIQKDMDKGPSTKMDDSNMNDIPPYLADSWWVTK